MVASRSVAATIDNGRKKMEMRKKEDEGRGASTVPRGSEKLYDVVGVKRGRLYHDPFIEMSGALQAYPDQKMSLRASSNLFGTEDPAFDLSGSRSPARVRVRPIYLHLLLLFHSLIKLPERRNSFSCSPDERVVYNRATREIERRSPMRVFRATRMRSRRSRFNIMTTAFWKLLGWPQLV
ncbi:hypothetical protein QYF36_016920 [Acer negundo]|nr:hypothetical protein QYF36_016920 [Acer negundo]